MKAILLAIVTIAIIHETNAHNHWKPNEDCLNGRIDAWKCCLASEATIYLKHPKSCDLYFKCAYKHLELKRCHLGHHWSVKHQKCQKPKEAQCENTSTTTTTISPKPTTTTKPSQWQLPKGCYDGSITINECCKMSQKWYELIPDQNNCHKFYKCYKGKSYHLSCPPHFNWSDEKRKCVYSLHTGCDTKPTTTTESTLTTAAPGRLPNGCYDGSIPSLKCCKMDIGKSTRDIPIKSLIGENFDLDETSRHYHHSSSSEEKIFNGEFLADSKDCHKYYKCVLGKPLHLSCPYHTKWDIQSRKCVYTINTKCTQPELTTSTTTTTETSTSTTTEITTTTTQAPLRLPDGCYDGSIKAKECCNMEIGKTMRDLQSMVAENFVLKSNLRHHSSEEKFDWNSETLADPKDCHKYFQCKSGKPVHLSCPSHYKWSIELGKCVYSSSKKCTDPESTTVGTTSTTTEKTTDATTLPPIITTPKPWRLPGGCYDGSIKATKCCKIERDTKDIAVKTLIGENFDLEDYSEQQSSSSSSEETMNWNNETLADPKDCHKYFQCKSGKPVHLSCPSHYKWNIELEKCVYSESKKCTDSDFTTKPSTTTTEAEITTSIIENSTITTTPVTTTTAAAPWRLPEGCYDGSIKAPKCCKIKINETMDASSSSISNSKEKLGISLELLIAENFDLIKSTEQSGSKSSEEENDSNTESLADPKNCHKYFKCENGKPIHKSCPKHTKWNIELGQCVYAIYEKCSDLEPTTTPSLTTDVVTTTKQTTTEEVTITEPASTTTDSISTTTEDEVSTTEESSTTTTHETTSTARPTSSSEETTTSNVFTTTEEPTTAEAETTTEWPVTPEATTTSKTSTEATTTPDTVTSTSEKTTSTEGITSTVDPTTTEAETTTEWPVTPEATTTSKTSTEATTTSETVTSTSEKTTTTEAVTSTEKPSTTEAATPTDRPLTTEETTSTGSFTPTDTATSTSETTIASSTTEGSETVTTTENPTTSEETTATEANTTTEAITTTTTAATDKTTTSEATTTTEVPTTSEETTTTERTITTDIISSTAITTSTSEQTTSTSEGSNSSEVTITTKGPTTSEEITTTEIFTTTETATTNEPITTAVTTETTAESITTNTEDASTTDAVTITTQETTISEDLTTTTTANVSSTEPISSTTGVVGTTTAEATTTTEVPITTVTSLTTSTDKPTTTEDATKTSEAISTPTVITTTTEKIPSTETTISTTENSVTTITTTTTEIPNNSTTEANTDPTPDPNGSCGTASYKCRHGIISAEECCKGVPYWEDRLLQNNDNCGTYFQCVHEVPQVRICPAGLYWNADVCRCEWKQLSTCNF